MPFHHTTAAKDVGTKAIAASEKTRRDTTVVAPIIGIFTVALQPDQLL
jgi:hypothetical protein